MDSSVFLTFLEYVLVYVEMLYIDSKFETCLIAPRNYKTPIPPLSNQSKSVLLQRHAAAW